MYDTKTFSIYIYIRYRIYGRDALDLTVYIIYNIYTRFDQVEKY